MPELRTQSPGSIRNLLCLSSLRRNNGVQLMPRNMSFSLTTEQVRNRQKTVTRRLGWRFLKPGDVLNACVKCMGLKKGEKIERICRIRVVDVMFEPLCFITLGDVIREGFPDWGPQDFIQMFCRHNKVPRDI